MKKLLSFLIFGVILLSLVSAQNVKLETSSFISPRAIQLHDSNYGIVGETFEYSIFIKNNNSKNIISQLNFTIYDPTDRIIVQDFYFDFSVSEYNSSSIFSKIGETQRFTIPGNYKFVVCLNDPEIVLFNKQLVDSELDISYELFGSKDYYPNCLDNYFEVVWPREGKLLEEQKENTDKTILLSEKTVELNKSLQNYTILIFVLTVVLVIFASAEMISNKEKRRGLSKIFLASFVLLAIFLTAGALFLTISFIGILIKNFSWFTLIFFILMSLTAIFGALMPWTILYQMYQDAQDERDRKKKQIAKLTN